MSPMKAFMFSLLAIVAVALVGCKGGGGETAVIGKWKGEIKLPEAKKDDPGAKMAEAFASMMSMDLELKADHKFTMTMMMFPIDGDWSMSGNRVSLVPKSVMGMTVEDFKKKQAASGSMSKSSDSPDKPIELELAGDGKTMKGIDTSSGAKSGELVFTKS